jgi:hypothetical protein
MSKFLPHVFLFFILMPLNAIAQQAFDGHATQGTSQFEAPHLGEKPKRDSLLADQPNPPSIGGAFMRSLVIPGWGQRRGGAKTSARNFFVAEVLLWSGFAALQVQGNWLTDDYKLFAASHAGAEVAGKNDQFFVDVGNFISVDEFNQNSLRRRDVEGLYDPATHFWRWDTQANQFRFANLRKRSDRAYSTRIWSLPASLPTTLLAAFMPPGWPTSKLLALMKNKEGE